jgi:hypothetical protein
VIVYAVPPPSGRRGFDGGDVLALLAVCVLIGAGVLWGRRR